MNETPESRHLQRRQSDGSHQEQSRGPQRERNADSQQQRERHAYSRNSIAVQTSGTYAGTKCANYAALRFRSVCTNAVDELFFGSPDRNAAAASHFGTHSAVNTDVAEHYPGNDAKKWDHAYHAADSGQGCLVSRGKRQSQRAASAEAKSAKVQVRGNSRNNKRVPHVTAFFTEHQEERHVRQD